MRPLAHHLGEESLVNLLVLSGGGLLLIATAGRAQLARALARRVHAVRWVGEGKRRRPR